MNSLDDKLYCYIDTGHIEKWFPSEEAMKGEVTKQNTAESHYEITHEYHSGKVITLGEYICAKICGADKDSRETAWARQHNSKGEMKADEEYPKLMTEKCMNCPLKDRSLYLNAEGDKHAWGLL